MVFDELSGLVIGSIPGSDFNLTGLPPEIVSNISGLITVLTTAGIIFIGYIVFLVVKWIFNIKRYKKIRKMAVKLDEIDRKLDLLLGEGISKSKIHKHQKMLSKTQLKKKIKNKK